MWTCLIKFLWQCLCTQKHLLQNGEDIFSSVVFLGNIHRLPAHYSLPEKRLWMILPGHPHRSALVKLLIHIYSQQEKYWFHSPYRKIKSVGYYIKSAGNLNNSQFLLVLGAFWQQIQTYKAIFLSIRIDTV